MATEVLNRQASDRQLAYIKSLQMEIGQGGLEIDNEISSTEASKIIDRLITQKNGSPRINEPRLGMAMKECFRIWTGNGWNIWEEKRKEFIKDVIRTYDLFTEIAQKVGST
jgi:hypothetical protein